jgi:hypothetical protein
MGATRLEQMLHCGPNGQTRSGTHSPWQCIHRVNGDIGACLTGGNYAPSLPHRDAHRP